MNRSDINTILIFVVSTTVGFIVWLVQRSINTKATKNLQTEKDLLAERAQIAEERRQVLATEHQKVLVRLSDLERRDMEDSTTLALLKQEVLPMAEAMKRKLVEILTHPSDGFKIADDLLAKLNTAGAAMPPELVPILAKRAVSNNPFVTEQEKLAAQALPIIVKLAELENREPDLAVTGIQLVTSTDKSHAEKRQEEKRGFPK